MLSQLRIMSNGCETVPASIKDLISFTPNREDRLPDHTGVTLAMRCVNTEMADGGNVQLGSLNGYNPAKSIVV